MKYGALQDRQIGNPRIFFWIGRTDRDRHYVSWDDFLWLYPFLRKDYLRQLVGSFTSGRVVYQTKEETKRLTVSVVKPGESGIWTNDDDDWVIEVSNTDCGWHLLFDINDPELALESFHDSDQNFGVLETINIENAMRYRDIAIVTSEARRIAFDWPKDELERLDHGVLDVFAGFSRFEEEWRQQDWASEEEPLP